MDVTKDQSRVFPSIGCCIYCGSDGNGEPLTTEHVYPKGMGGGLVFLDASCKACQLVIDGVENACMKRTLLPYRTVSQLTKNRNGPKTVPLLLDFDLKGPTKVAVEDHPQIVILPGLRSLPGVLEGRPRQSVLNFEYKIFGATGIVDETKENLQGQKHVGIDLDGVAWLRMLAKIAHGYAVAELGSDGFLPMLPDLILGRDLSLCTHLVGQYSEAWPIPEPPPIAIIDMRRAEVNGLAYVAVILRLLAELGPETPAYAVIAGTFIDKH